MHHKHQLWEEIKGYAKREEWERAPGCPFGPLEGFMLRKKLNDADWDPALSVSYRITDHKIKEQ